MFFEKCPNCDPGNWQEIAPNQLRLELASTYPNTDETIDMILKHNGLAKTPTATYRRGKPALPVKDWAKS